MIRTRACPTLRNFASWLAHTTLPPSLVDNRTLNAISRRLQLTLEAKLFDGQDLTPIKVTDLLIPGRVSVFPMDHIKDEKILSMLALHIINEIASYKLTARENCLPTMILVDEAHNFFPSRVERERKEYIGRLIKRAKTICKEGRKPAPHHRSCPARSARRRWPQAARSPLGRWAAPEQPSTTQPQ